MSNQTVVDVIISGSTTTIVDKRINGVTTVAGAPPITNVSGQVPDLGVNTDILAAEGDILSLTNDVANLRANLIVTGTTLTDEIGVLSGHVISTGNNLEFQISTLSGNLIASGNNLDSLRDILSGNLGATGSNLKASITGITGDIDTLTSNLISTGNNLETQILNSGDILNDVSGNLIVSGQTLTSEINTVSGLVVDNANNLISTGNNLGPKIDGLSGDLIETGVKMQNILRETGFTIDAISGEVISNNNDILALNTSTGILSSATGELQEYKIGKEGGIISGSITPSSSGSFDLGSPSLVFQTGFFDNLDVSNTLFLGDVPIKSASGGIDFSSSTGVTIFEDVSIRNITVTGTETIIDVENLAVKDNIILLNSGETDAGIGLRSGGLVIDRGTLPDADFLFNENDDRFEIDFPLAVNGNVVVTQNQTGVYADSSNLIQTGVTLQNQITSNNASITSLGVATGELKTQSNATDSNLTTTGQTLTSEIAIVSGIAGGSTFDALSGNLITTGQTLTSEIAIVSGIAGGSDLSTLSGNLITTGQTLQAQITSNDSDISALISNTGSIIDDVSGNLITTGQTLQTQISSNDSDIITLTENLRQTGVTSRNYLIETGFAVDNISGSVDAISGNLISTGKYLTDEIATVSGMATGGAAADIISGDLITTGQTLTSEIGIISGLTVTNTNNLISTGNNLQGQITSNDGQIAGIIGDLINTGQTLTTNDNTISSNLITTGQTLTSEIAIVSGIATGGSAQDFRELSGNLITTGQTLQAQVTSNDSDVTSLTSNLITTGQTLTSEIAIVSGLAGGGDIDTLSGNLITTGQTLQTQITSNDSDITNLTSNLGTTGQTLQTQITSNDSDISTLTSNLVTTGQTLTTDITTVSGLIVDNDGDITALKTATGVLKTSTDSNSANLITTGQTLQTQITSNDSDISSLTSNLVTTGQTLQTQITSNDGDISTLTTNLGTTGQTLQTQITSNDSDISTLTSNLITTGQTLQTQISSNDSDISTLTSNLVTTGQTLTTNINTVSSNLISTGEVIDDISGNLIITGQTLQTQITSNDGDITTLTSNLVTTGQTLTTNINTVSTNLVSTGAVVDDISGNLITTGQTLQTQINSNDGDITTLTSNLVTTGQTLTTNINTVSTNLGTSGQTLQTQITSNDSDISTLTSNLGTTGQTLQTQITSNDSDIASLTTNLGTTGQTLQTQITSNDSDISTLDSTTVKLTTNQSVAGNKIFTNNVTINNLTVTGTEVIVDVENLAVKDNIIEINSGESSAGISKISGGIVIDRGTATNANILFNDANDRFELNFPLAVEGEVVASASNLITTGQTLTTNINTVSTNLGTSGQTLQTQITSNDSDISTLTTNLGTSGQTLQTQITSNDSDISTLTTNLGTSGQTLQTQITSNDSDISTLTSNLVTTGQTLQTQITSNDSDISTLTSNLITTGQTLTTNINTVSTNLGASGQTLQTQITSNDTDITNLTSNLVTTGQTLTTNINTVANNLGTTGQTLTSEIATVSGLIPATVIDGAGTANKVPLWSDSNTIGDSVISQSSSKVGIGIASPSFLLHLQNASTPTIRVDNTVNNSRLDLRAEDSAVLIRSTSNFPMRFDVNQTERMRIDTAGNVGIGTASPNYKLHTVGGAGVFDVTGAATLNHHLAVTEVATLPDWRPYAGTTTAALQIQSSATRGILLAAKSTGNQDFYNTDGLDIYVSSTVGSSSSNKGTLAISAKSDGNVGIGTPSPTGGKLQVAGKVRIDAGSGNDALNLNAYDLLKWDNSSHIHFGGYKTGQWTALKFYAGSTERLNISSDVNVQGATDLNINGPSRRLSFTSGTGTVRTTTSNNLILQTNSTDALTIDASQNVIVGNGGNDGGATIRPGGQTSVYALTVDRSGSSGTSVDIWDYNSNSVIIGATSSEKTLTVKAGGNVGIGTDDPDYNLHVNGVNSSDIYITSTAVNSYARLSLENDAQRWNILVAGSQGDRLSFYDSNNTAYRMVIETSGNVGIGTDSPSQKLDVIGRIRSSFNSGDYFEIGSSDNGGFVVGKSGGTEVVNVRTYGDSYFNGGNFGIGTASPSQALNIVRSDASGSAEFDLYSTNSAKQPMLTFRKSASNTIGTKSVTPSGGELGEIEFIGVNTGSNFAVKSASIIGLQDGAAGATYIPGALTFGTGTNAAAVSERMRITSAGNVGIGTASPTANLTVLGVTGTTIIQALGADSNGFADVEIKSTGTTGASRLFFSDAAAQSGFIKYNHSDNSMQFGTSASVRMHIDTSGKVGIGTVTPASLLHIYSSAPVFTVQDGGAWGTNATAYVDLKDGTSSMAYVGVTGTDGHLDIKQLKAGSLRLYTNNTERVSILSDGNVGIGTVAPGTELHVKGAGTVAQFEGTGGNVFIQFKDSDDGTLAFIGADGGDLKFQTPTGSYSDKLTIKNDGKVGIGTVSPSAGLHVVNATEPTVLFESTNAGSSGSRLQLYHNSASPADNDVLSNIQITGKDSGGTKRYAALIQTIAADVNASSVDGDIRFLTYKADVPSEVMRITHDASVGIGTASPSSKLHISGADNTSAKITLTNTAPSPDNQWSLHAGYNDQSLRFLGDSTTVMTLLDSGKVGIGTASPAYELEVSTASNSRITASNTGYSVVNHLQADNTGGWVGTLSNHPLIIKTNNTEKVRVTTAGSVGIGTDPKAKFEVDLNQTSGTLAADNYAHFGGQHHSNGSVMGITLGYREANLLYRKVGIVARGLGDNAARQDLDFLVSTVNSSTSVTPSDAKLTISGLTGYVGIGTVSPSYKLHVVGGAGVFDVTGADSVNHHLTVSEGTPTDWRPYSGNTTATLQVQNSATRGLLLAAKSTGSQQLITSQGFDINVNATVGTNAGTAALSILTDGNVGIGTASPASKLQIVSSTSGDSVLKVDGTNGTLFEVVDDLSDSLMSVNDAAGLPVFEVFADNHIVAGRYNQNDFYLDTNGKVGIGNSAPGDQWGNGNNLVIGTNSGNNGMTICAGTSNEGGIFFADGASGADEYRGQIKYSHSNNDFVFAVNAAEVVRFNSNGSITSSTGASLTSGGAWTDASSRELKKDIVNLSLIKASQVVKLLTPVEFSYKTAPEERRVGFIAEDVPDLVASEGRKGLSSMQIVAALTKVVQNQQKEIEWCKEQIEKLTKIK